MRIALILALLISSCGRATRWPARVVFDTKTVSAATSYQWSQYVNDLNDTIGEKVVKFDSDLSTEDRLFAYTIVIRLDPEESSEGHAGEASPGRTDCFITIFPISVKFSIEKTVLWHEIGHCVGLPHTDTNSDIMSPAVGSFKSYPPNKIKRFADDFLNFFHRRER